MDFSSFIHGFGCLLVCTAELPQGYKLQMDDIFYFILLILFLAFRRRYFFNDYSSWYYFSFQLQCGYTPAHCYFVNGCICLLLIDSPNRTQMLAFRLCIILLACHQAGPMPANTLCLPEAQWPRLVYPDTCANQHACLRLCFLGRS